MSQMMQQAASTERRRYPRTLVSWPVRLWIDGIALDGTAQDVSEHGICVVTAPTAAVKLGSSYRIDVLAGGGAPRSIVADARHADPHGRSGFESDALLIDPSDVH